jgi:hypothetical protein
MVRACVGLVSKRALGQRWRRPVRLTTRGIVRSGGPCVLVNEAAEDVVADDLVL